MRRKFAARLNKGLYSLRLPVKYMAILCLASNDPVKSNRLTVKDYIVKNIQQRISYMKKNNTSKCLYTVLYSVQCTLSCTPSSTLSCTLYCTPSSTLSSTPSSTPSSTLSCTPSSTLSCTPSSTLSYTPSCTPSSTLSCTPSIPSYTLSLYIINFHIYLIHYL